MLLTGTDLLTIERTLQLAIAPAFILGGIMALLSLLSSRLQRVGDLYEEARSGVESPLTDLHLLARRARLIYRAITFAIASAVILCILVIAAFVEPLAGVRAGGQIAGLLLLGMLSLTASLACFLREVLMSRDKLPTLPRL
ncbi:DUF2721 domain-containing protein [Neoroseomonas oryzicola]|uniref:DUF2721 domain-containing protein n=1 Tax=Neoroseomonas oryzicola TaxID=535904 RepID=A0A9X9WG59_9PROT|nr:DUF2721 domain-containing protein [Neoroseomonas oryzicola]MBR0659319.1 DUF2721 domain-containing protein [Neoroseomonas oryzicola]NKE16221.1 DUF2721 domain-containing protein [Neoroseomonas oryzicola]